MNRMSTLLLVALLCVPLAACRGRARSTSNACNPCAPPCDPCDPCQPAPITYAPNACAPNSGAQGPMVVYEPPPAPTEYPANAPSAQEYDALAADLNVSVQRNADAERILNEQEMELQRLRDENERLARDMSDPTPAPYTPPVATGAGGARRCSTLAGDLRDMGGLEVIEDGNTVIVRVTDAFRSGSERLKANTRLVASLRDAATALKLYPDARVAVVGHSDSQPIRKSPWANNAALSLARAQTVRGVLADNGVQTSRIAVDGRGEMEPLVSPERSSADRARNRRVEIRIQF